MGPVAAPALRRGDHACCVFHSDDEQTRLVASFARDAIARGDRLFYLADRSSDDQVLTLLEAAGLDGRAELESGTVEVMHSSEMDLGEGFDVARAVTGWDGLIARARTDGFGGLAVAAEMTWAQSWSVDPDLLVEYERRAAVAFEGCDFVALCQYDARWVDKGLLPSATHAHPCAIQAHAGRIATDYQRLRIEWPDGPAIVTIGGDVDLANVDFLADQLTKLLSEGDLVADCSGLRFIDVAGCRLL